MQDLSLGDMDMSTFLYDASICYWEQSALDQLDWLDVGHVFIIFAFQLDTSQIQTQAGFTLSDQKKKLQDVAI